MLKFLYQTMLGRSLLKILIHPRLSEQCGKFLDTGYSRFLIPLFVKKNGIDLSGCEKKEIRQYVSFNECFCRKLEEGQRRVNAREEILISPCDGFLSAYSIKDDLVIPVKQSRYRISDLLRDEQLARRFDGGTCLVFRLCVNHYHRYCYPDSGRKECNVFLPGVLHTVRPIALRERPVFTENAREYTLLHTDHFGDMIQMEVGAMLVGRICNRQQEGSFVKGQEKGWFQYGGSTILLLLEKDQVQIAPQLYRNTKEGRETVISFGQGIGTANKKSFQDSEKKDS